MKMLAKGKIPPSRIITPGSINHFFSGIGLGTALILKYITPLRFCKKEPSVDKNEQFCAQIL